VKNTASLRAALESIEAERRSIDAAVDGELNDEQAARWLALDESESEARAALEEAEAVEARAAKVAESRARYGSVSVSVTGPTGADAEEVRYLRPTEARDRALRTLESEARSLGHLADDQLAKVERLIRHRGISQDGDAIARRLLITETPAYRSAFLKAMTQAAPAFTSEEARAIDEFRAMSIGTDSGGGFGVPVLIDPSIILTAQGSLNPFRRIARQVTITTDEWKGVSSTGVSWSIDSEAATVSDDSPTLAQPTVTTGTARGFIPYSLEVGQDYPSFAAEMSTLLAEGYDELQASHFATGSVSATNRGILTALDANTNVEVTPTTDGQFTGADINKVWGALPDRYRSNATWVMNTDVANEVASFASSNNLSFLTVDLTGEVETLRKRPVEISSYFPDFTGTTGASNIAVVGDFRNFVIADRAGMNVELVPHLFDVTNNRPTGQRGWFAWARFGSNSVNDLGFRLLQNQ
jgi:HK97 family phage major capsid protein